MKYITLLLDGLADRPIKELGDKTILQAANIPNINKLAKDGICGMINTVPEGMAAGSDICNLSIFGYNPKECYTGRSPLEAASIGVELGENDLALRCNFVTICDDNTMESFTAHHITDEHGQNIIDKLNEMFKSDTIEFYKGVSYRNLLVLRNVKYDLDTTPPHDITGQEVANYYPKGNGSDLLNELMQKASVIFNGSEKYGKANAIWLWGEGTKPTMAPYIDMYGKKGAVISAVDLIRGIGVCTKQTILHVDGMTGFLDTNFEGKAEAAIEALKEHDHVFIHVEAPDETGHLGDYEKKVESIELIDKRMLPIIMDGLNKYDEYRILITPDHATPVELKTHSKEAIPAIIYGTDVKADKNETYTEYVKPTFDIKDGYKIADYFFNIEKYL